MIFWICVTLVFYTYLGYPLLARAISILRPKPIQKRSIEPTVSLIIAAYNEENTIRAKLENTLALDYPREKLDILVAAHGSTDGTLAVAREFEPLGVRVLHRPEREGKPAALNRAVQEASSEILFFSDANTVYRPDTIRKIVRNFADARVGGVSGRKIVLEDGERESSEGETAYWSYEAALKNAESLIGSIVTADGEIFALRRSLFEPMPAGMVHDDMYLSLKIIEKGYRLVYETEATSAEYASRTIQDEFHLKVRYASAGYQILSYFRRMFLPPGSWFAIQFLSHKLLRWLAPFFLLGALAASAALPGVVYRGAFWAQGAFYLAALIGWCFRRKNAGPALLYFPLYFSVMNVAALYGFVRYFTVGQTPLWRKASR